MCGGGEEFTRFYNEHFRAIFGFVLAKVDHREEEAESLTQEIFCKVYFRICRPPAVNDFKAFLWTTAWHTVIQYWGKNKRKIISLDSCVDEDNTAANLLLRDLINPGDLPTDAELREIQEYIRTIVRALPAKERAVIELHYLDGAEKTWKEIAGCLGCSEPTARIRFKRAMERLQKQLEADLGG